MKWRVMELTEEESRREALRRMTHVYYKRYAGDRMEAAGMAKHEKEADDIANLAVTQIDEECAVGQEPPMTNIDQRVEERIRRIVDIRAKQL